MEAATRRRLHEELGLESELRFLFKFQYHAQFDADGAERELCSVFIGRGASPPRVDSKEIRDWRWIRPEQLQAELAGPMQSGYTPWFLMEWERIWRDHRAAVLALHRPQGLA